jgi:hypothetical protein
MFEISPHHRRCRCRLQDRTTSRPVPTRKPAENGQPMRGKPKSVWCFCFVLYSAAVRLAYHRFSLNSSTIEAVGHKSETPRFVVAASSCKVRQEDKNATTLSDRQELKACLSRLSMEDYRVDVGLYTKIACNAAPAKVIRWKLPDNYQSQSQYSILKICTTHRKEPLKSESAGIPFGTQKHCKNAYSKSCDTSYRLDTALDCSVCSSC